MDQHLEALEDIRNTVAEWQLGDALYEIAKFSWNAPTASQVGDMPDGTGEDAGYWHADVLAYVAKIAILYCQRDGGMTPSEGDVRDVFSRVYRYSDPMACAKELKGEDPSYTNATCFVNRVLAVQNRLRGFTGNDVARYIDMLDFIPAILQHEDALQVDWIGEIEDLIGFSARDLGLIYGSLERFGARFMSETPFWFGRGKIQRFFEQVYPHPQKFNRFLEQFSCDQGEFIDLAERRAGDDPHFEYYFHNPLIEKPIIRVANRYFVPSRAHLRIALTSGVFWHLRNHFASDVGEGQNPIDADFGQIFELYVKRVVGAQLSDGEWASGVHYDGREWADLAIFGSSSAILTEVKAHGFSLSPYETGAFHEADEDLMLNISKASEQLAHNLSCEVMSQMRGVLPKSGKAQEWYPLVILHETLFHQNSLPVKTNALNIAGTEELSPDTLQVLDIGEWEMMIAVTEKVHPCELISSKVENGPHMPISNYIREVLGIGNDELEFRHTKAVWSAVLDELPDDPAADT